LIVGNMRFALLDQHTPSDIPWFRIAKRLSASV
jgi:hypothetical protein